jgi:hypothetical protein
MKKLLFLNVFFLSLAATAQQNVTLFLNIGQSNGRGGAGYNSNYAVLPSAGSYEFRVIEKDLIPTPEAGNGEAINFNPAHQAHDMTFTPQMSAKYKQLSGNDIITIPAAWGSTTIAEWVNQPGGWNWPLLVGYLNDCKAYCNSHGITIKHIYAGWIQGENDAVSGTSAATYYDQFNQLANDLHAIGVERVFTTRIAPEADAPAANTEQILRGELMAAISNQYIQKTTNFPSTFTQAGGFIEPDGVHWSAKAQYMIGDSIAYSMDYWERNHCRNYCREYVPALMDLSYNATLCGSGTLPVKLISFTAGRSNQSVLLSWKTASEEGFDHFEIERSADGRSFQKIATIHAAGAGYPYQHIDQVPLTGQNFYRLKMVDQDGKFSSHLLYAYR